MFKRNILNFYYCEKALYINIYIMYEVSVFNGTDIIIKLAYFRLLY